MWLKDKSKNIFSNPAGVNRQKKKKTISVILFYFNMLLDLLVWVFDAQ